MNRDATTPCLLLGLNSFIYAPLHSFADVLALADVLAACGMQTRLGWDRIRSYGIGWVIE